MITLAWACSPGLKMDLPAPPPHLSQLTPLARDDYLDRRHRVEIVMASSVATDVDRAVTLGELGSWLHTYGFARDAVSVYAMAIEHDPTVFRWRYLEAQALRQDGRVAESLTVLEKLANSGSTYPPVWVWMGEVRRSQGEVELAEIAYRRAIELDGECAMAMYGLARLAIERGSWDRARRLLDRVLQLQPQATPALAAQARVMREMGDEAAAARLRARIPIDKRDQRHLSIHDPEMHRVESIRR